MPDTNQITNSAIEQALASYKNSMHASPEHFRRMLSHLPEETTFKEVPTKKRSPYYVWLAVTQAVVVCSLVIMVYPTWKEMYTYRNDPFYTTDKQIEAFEAGINAEDSSNMMVDYTNNL